MAEKMGKLFKSLGVTLILTGTTFFIMIGIVIPIFCYKEDEVFEDEYDKAD
jgi:hypothetical protein